MILASDVLKIHPIALNEVCNKYRGIVPRSCPWGQAWFDIAEESLFIGSFPVRDFLVYAAIQSILGRCSIRVIRRSLIKARVAGLFSTEAIGPKAPLISDKQLRVSIERLSKRNLIRTINSSRTKTWFTTSLDPEEFAKIVIGRVQIKPIKKARQVSAQELFDRGQAIEFRGQSEGPSS